MWPPLKPVAGCVAAIRARLGSAPVDLAQYTACDATELRRLIAAGELDPEEVREAALRAIEAVAVGGDKNAGRKLPPSHASQQLGFLGLKLTVREHTDLAQFAQLPELFQHIGIRRRCPRHCGCRGRLQRRRYREPAHDANDVVETELVDHSAAPVGDEHDPVRGPDRGPAVADRGPHLGLGPQSELGLPSEPLVREQVDVGEKTLCLQADVSVQRGAPSSALVLRAISLSFRSASATVTSFSQGSRGPAL
jgi:hypothetical protein